MSITSTGIRSSMAGSNGRLIGRTPVFIGMCNRAFTLQNGASMETMILLALNDPTDAPRTSAHPTGYILAAQATALTPKSALAPTLRSPNLQRCEQTQLIPLNFVKYNLEFQAKITPV